MRFLSLPDGLIKDSAKRIRKVFTDLAWNGYAHMHGVSLCRWPEEYWTDRSSYPADFNPKDEAIQRAFEKQANNIDPFSGEDMVGRRKRVRNGLIYFINAPRIYSDRHSIADNFFPGIYLTIVRGQPYMLINNFILGQFPRLHQLSATRSIFDYKLFPMSTVDQWAKQMDSWMDDQRKRYASTPPESRAA